MTREAGLRGGLSTAMASWLAPGRRRRALRGPEPAMMEWRWQPPGATEPPR